MSQSFFIKGRLPDLNEIIASAKQRRNGWNGYHLLKQEFDTIIRYEIKQAKIKPMKKFFLECSWREPNRRRDPDGFVVAKKFILDALVQAKIIPNDGWSEITGFADTFHVVKKGEEGVQVTLRS